MFKEQALDTIADALVERGYVVLEGALPDALLKSLADYLEHLSVDQFKAAGIGRKDQFQLAADIRSDQIHWISPTETATADFLVWMESLRVGLNQRLYMGLFDYESHFARYAAGAFYKKHLDAFKGQGIRRLSTVLYLNENWQQSDGGELVIYGEDDQKLETLLPVWGRLVIFLSEKFPHEVLPASKERKSIAGWFRVSQQ